MSDLYKAESSTLIESLRTPYSSGVKVFTLSSNITLVPSEVAVLFEQMVITKAIP